MTFIEEELLRSQINNLKLELLRAQEWLDEAQASIVKSKITWTWVWLDNSWCLAKYRVWQYENEKWGADKEGGYMRDTGPYLTCIDAMIRCEEDMKLFGLLRYIDEIVRPEGTTK